MTEVVNLESNEDIDVKINDKVQSPTHDSSCREEDSSAGYNLECMDPLELAGLLLVELDNNVQTERNYPMLQKELVEQAASSLRFFVEPAEIKRPNNQSVKVSATLSRGHVDCVRLDRRKEKVFEDQFFCGA